MKDLNEYKYPMWFKHKNKGYIIKFYNLQKGELVAGFTSWLDRGMIIEDFTPHTDKTIWEQTAEPKESWVLETVDYRIKEQKKKVTIEKWLINDGHNHRVVEAENINDVFSYAIKKVKLLETYEVEI